MKTTLTGDPRRYLKTTMPISNLADLSEREVRKLLDAFWYNRSDNNMDDRKWWEKIVDAIKSYFPRGKTN